MKNKKSLSSMISTILIILIILVSFSIIYIISMGFIKKNTKEIPIEAFLVDLKIEKAIYFITGEILVSVKRGTQTAEIDELRFVFFDENGNSYSVSKKEDLPKELEKKTFYFSSNKSLGKLKKVSVAPVFKNRIYKEISANFSEEKEFPSGIVSWIILGSQKKDIINNHKIIFHGENEKNSKFSGNEEDYIEIVEDESKKLSFEKQFSISLWVYPEEYGGNLISKGKNNQINYNISLSKDGKIIFSYTNKGTFVEFYSRDKLELNKWNHIVVSVETLESNFGKMIVNKNLQEILLALATPDINNENIIIGKNFKGKINNIILFNKTLDYNQASFLYNIFVD